VRVGEAPLPNCDPSLAPQQIYCGATSPARGEVRSSNSFDTQGIQRLQAGGISIQQEHLSSHSISKEASFRAIS
jgi:hypothetical protein